MEDFQHVGVWWLPENPAGTVAGTLSFSNEDGLTLELIGSFLSLLEVFESGGRSQPVILGVTRRGKQVTLTNCRSNGTSTSFPGFPSEKYRCSVAYVGAHFAAEEELRFHKADISLNHLIDWVGKSGFTLKYRQYEGSVTIDETHISYKHPEKVAADTSKGTITIAYGMTQGGEVLRDMTFRQNVFLYVEPLLAVTLDEMLEQYVVPLQNLVGLGTNRPNTLTNLSVYAPGKTQPVRDAEERDIPIKVFFQARYAELRERGKLYPHDMLFWFEDIAEDFGGVLERWFALCATLDSVYQLYFSVQQTPGMYLQQQFMNIVQAAESYHRRRIAPQGPPSTEHQQKLAAIMANTPDEYRGWLSDKVRYSHEPGLRQRLRDLFDKTEAVVAPLVQSRATLVRKATDTRNYQTHYDPSLENQAVREPEPLYYLTDALVYMVRTLFLEELGLSAERCVELFRRNQAYLYAITERPKV